MAVDITNYGGRIVRWMAPDRNGRFQNIVLGFNSIDTYLKAHEPYFGSIIGRFSNRIENGQFSLNGKKYSLTINNGVNHLHGGANGFHHVVWEATQHDPQNLTLGYKSTDGEEGYPGDLTVEVHYELTDKNELKIKFNATTSKPTIVNLTSHSFFNLAGVAGGSITDHQLMINADTYTPIKHNLIPSGEIAPVQHTPFDFTSPTSIGKRINQDNLQLNIADGYDHNFILAKEKPNALSLAAQVTETASGRTMTIHTTKPGLQFYSGNFLNGKDKKIPGIPFNRRTAFCLEPQFFPNSPNQSNFPSTTLRPGDVYKSTTVYTLGVFPLV